MVHFTAVLASLPCGHAVTCSLDVRWRTTVCALLAPPMFTSHLSGRRKGSEILAAGVTPCANAAGRAGSRLEAPCCDANWAPNSSWKASSTALCGVVQGFKQFFPQSGTVRVLCQLIPNHFFVQSPKFTLAGKAPDICNIVVDRLTRSLYALAEDDLAYYDTLWSRIMSGWEGHTVIKLCCGSKSPINLLSLTAYALN